MSFYIVSVKILSTTTLAAADLVKPKPLTPNGLEHLFPVTRVADAKPHPRCSFTHSESIMRPVRVQIGDQRVGVGQNLDQIRQPSQLIVESNLQFQFDAVFRAKSKEGGHGLAPGYLQKFHEEEWPLSEQTP
jgi:hypothetical protein